MTTLWGWLYPWTQFMTASTKTLPGNARGRECARKLSDDSNRLSKNKVILTWQDPRATQIDGDPASHEEPCAASCFIVCGLVARRAYDSFESGCQRAMRIGEPDYEGMKDQYLTGFARLKKKVTYPESCLCMVMPSSYSIVCRQANRQSSNCPMGQ